MGAYFQVDPRNIHAYVMGEHGDSEFVPWSQAMLSTAPVLALLERSRGRYTREGLEHIREEVRTAAQKIIAAKRATYYGIGMAMVRIVRAIWGDEHSVLTVSTMLQGEFGQRDVFAGVPAIVCGNGVRHILPLTLTEKELAAMDASCETLRESYRGLHIRKVATR